MQDSGSEKRRYKRIRRSFTARIRPYHQDAEQEGFTTKWDIVTIKDLSASGVSFNYTRRIVLGTILELNIALPFTKEPIHCIGEVCRIDDTIIDDIKTAKIPVYWIAVRFTEIDSDKKEAMAKFIERF